MKKYIPHLGKTQHHILKVLKDGGKITVTHKKVLPQGNVIKKYKWIDRFGFKSHINEKQIDAMMIKGLLEREATLSSVQGFIDWEYTIREEIKILIN